MQAIKERRKRVVGGNYYVPKMKNRRIAPAVFLRGRNTDQLVSVNFLTGMKFTAEPENRAGSIWTAFAWNPSA